ncbi:hypothetical protein K8374_15430 [Pseudomonas sp. p1(2021b)]|uniref:NEL-type E3 ubiquitin ligase domain-containing protein n=1 Tax=Pseudomonas sp. p1(2021b) TaxID=2874628 RepID=UPI001CC9FA32|nr:NEL-type E3 ubiquitin ligase domain-containing protein [Pseudomonas sp. p1(2021b)]UBM23779.1 hypothetical protein K8374_15430 [Pseudomonas sp. p1(2021b)]
MTARDNPSLEAARQAKLATATDDFITKRLPAWLAQGSPGQISALRTHYKALKASQAKVSKATEALVGLEAYAKEKLRPLLPATPAPDQLQWREILPNLKVPLSTGWLDYQADESRHPGLLRLMQNFTEDARFFDGSGLVAEGEDIVLTPDLPALVRQCRSLDAGAGYQALLNKVFDPATCAALAAEKRAGLKLAAAVAVLDGRLGSTVQKALEQIVEATGEQGEQTLAYPGLLTVLGQPVADGLLVQLRNSQGEDVGQILYLGGDLEHGVRHYPSPRALDQALAEALERPDYQRSFSRRIALGQRPAWLALLNERLADAQPDLQIEGEPVTGDVFDGLVQRQVERLKAEARLLLVPTAEVDHQASKARLQAWRTAGLGLANLAGLFMPAVGAVLLGQFVVQTLNHVFEGALDWQRGHQHEALEHMLGVAENLAVASAMAAGFQAVASGFERSAFVDTLEPVIVDGQRARLWNNDLSVYACSPGDSLPAPDGLYGTGERRWLRRGRQYYEVHRPLAEGPWRLRHPERPDAFGPIVETNGERSWRLRQDNPLQWSDTARMLDTLWPLAEPLGAAHAQHILRIAVMEPAQVRGLLVEGQPLPVQLRDTLRRFEAHQRIEAFFERLQAATAGEPQIQAWCEAQPGMQGLASDALREKLLAEQAVLRDGLLDYLSQEVLANDDLRNLLQRDFPGLPDAYAQEAIRDVPAHQRRLALLEARVPLALARKARALRQQARLARALEGVYLNRADSDLCGELVLAVLSRLPNWPQAVNLELRQGSDTGPRLAVIAPQGQEQARTLLVRRAGTFRLYDYRGRALEEAVAEPGGIFQAVAAVLTPAQATQLGLAHNDTAQALRLRVQQHLPSTRKALLNLLGWREQAPWSSPLRRQADGRLGYPLSGRAVVRRDARATLRGRIRNLYPHFDDERVQAYLARLLDLPGSPFDVLLAQENSYAQLDEALHRWASAEQNAPRRTLRQRLGQRLRQAWRLQAEEVIGADGQPRGMRLDMSGFAVQVLPAIPGEVTFGHITELTMAGMDLAAVSTEFLRSFGSLQRLSLADNRLHRLPDGVAYLTELRTLQLARNGMRLDPAGIAILAALPRLEVLDLSFNPLGALSMRWNHLSRLDQLRLRRCHLTTWPMGLELCERLSYIDLRDNQIATVPDDTLQMPLVHRAAFIVEGNPLPGSQVARLVALDIDHLPHPAAADQPGALAETRDLWLHDSEGHVRHERRAQWDNLSSAPDSAGLFRLLGELQRTADFQSAREYLNEQVWSVLAFLADNPAARARLYEWANLPRSCSDSVARQFSDLLVQVQVIQAESRSGSEDAGRELLSLGRQLFRLDQLERFASQDIALRMTAGRVVDAIEVSLFYRVRLAEPLGLPAQPRSMRFTHLADVSQAQLQHALRTVQATETPGALVESLSARAFWRSYLQARHPDAFTAIDEHYALRGTQLDEQRTALSSTVYTQRWSRLQSERESAEQVLVEQLTHEVLEAQAAEKG